MRERGYAVAVDELEIGLTAVAAPVRNAHGDVVCSMSVSGPDVPARRRPGRPRCVPLVVEAADEVSHRLGWGHALSARRAGPDRVGLRSGRES